jgi:hypothetical protein
VFCGGHSDQRLPTRLQLKTATILIVRLALRRQFVDGGHSLPTLFVSAFIPLLLRAFLLAGLLF